MREPNEGGRRHEESVAGTRPAHWSAGEVARDAGDVPERDAAVGGVSGPDQTGQRAAETRAGSTHAGFRARIQGRYPSQGEGIPAATAAGT